jgi:hypothetical protein
MRNAEIVRKQRILSGHHPGTMQEHSRKFRVVKNEKRDMYYKAGYTHKKVFEGGGFLYLHRDHVAAAKQSRFCKR